MGRAARVMDALLRQPGGFTKYDLRGEEPLRGIRRLAAAVFLVVVPSGAGLIIAMGR